MKKVLITLAATAVCLGAMAQGKISFANDSLHLYYFDTAGNLKTGDAALAGTGATSAPTPSGVTLVVDLYAGTSAASLTLSTTTTLAAVPGKQQSQSKQVTQVAPGAVGTFQVQIHDAAYATAALAQAAGSYFGYSTIFTTTTGASIAYNSIVNPGSPAFSTWSPGSYDASAVGGPGALGAIDIQIVPEPTSLALAGLGAAALVIFRRRNNK